jgi:uncharacterized protein (TIRG00374 family)
MPPQLRQRIIFSLGFALIVFLALTFYADAPRLFDALAKFDWRFLPLAFATTLANFLLRFVRWHYYLGVIGVNQVTHRDSLLIFLAGFALTMTPGKLGEVLKSFLLKERYQTSVSYSASIIGAERLTDLLGMGLLAALGLAFYPLGIGALAAMLIALVAFVIIVQQHALVERMIAWLGHLPVIGRFANLARNLYESAYLMLRLKPLVIAITLSIAAWFGECVAFFFILLGVGVPASAELLLQATFIYAAATIFGAASMLPGGLGATEGSMALLTEQIVGTTREAGVAVTLIVRLVTLWSAVLLGVIALAMFGVPRQIDLSVVRKDEQP